MNATDTLSPLLSHLLNLGVALRAGLLRAPLPLGPAKAGLLRTLHIPNAVPTYYPLAGSPHCATASRSAPACGVRCCLACGQGSTLTCRAQLGPGHRQVIKNNHRSAGCDDLEKTTMKREEAMKLVENGIAALNDALRAGHSQTLERFLATLARFHNYSFGNAILIAVQRPEATHVAGFHTWKKLGGFVKKGEEGIAILAPMVSRKDQQQNRPEGRSDDSSLIFGFKVAYVFDVTQTDGKELPEFASAVGEPGEWLALLEESIREAGISLQYDYIPGGADGCSAKGKIIVRPDLPPNETFAVLAHELAHELLHQRSDRRKETTRRIRETEAEAVAYTVCLACGIDSTTRSADYIQLYRGSEETLRESLTFVQQAATEILSGLRKRREQQALEPQMTLSA